MMKFMTLIGVPGRCGWIRRPTVILFTFLVMAVFVHTTSFATGSPTYSNEVVRPGNSEMSGCFSASEDGSLRDFSVDEGLQTQGLRNEALILNLYRGAFIDVPIEKDDLRFLSLFSGYLQSYAKQCREHLPADRVEMTEQVCTEWMVTKNGWGIETGRTCHRRETRGTGLYADRDMYHTFQDLDRMYALDGFRHALRAYSSNDPVAEAMSLTGDMKVFFHDMEVLLRQNACDSPHLKRFEENLQLFALSKQPKRLGGETRASAIINPPTGSDFRDQDYTRLLDDLITDQSQSWVVNRYATGSISNVRVEARDAKRRPVKITAQYLYTGFQGRSRGSVVLTFDEGWPKCMYFFDNPAACRSPNRQIVAGYADGDYQ